MKFSSVARAAAAVGLASLASAADLPAIEVAGNKFFYSNNGSQFYIRGIAYQSDVTNSSSSSFTDPLADGDACKRDLPYLQELQTNVLRVYALNTTLDHTECMDLFSDAGIYIIADLSEPDLSINRDDPQWNVDLYKRYTGVIDAFHNYTNILGFFAGNEVTNNDTNTDASPYVKAAIRDCKAYMKEQGYRQIPVGYSSNDDSNTRVPMADYFACGDSDVKADFYGINMYEWCGDSTFEESGYEARTEEFKNLSIPLFFSEYGCNEVTPRQFTEVQALYGSDMTDVWSGGIVYMYFEETNNYGLVSIVDGSVSTLEDFSYLSKEIASISPTSVSNSSYTASTTSLSCPASTGEYWKASESLPPTPNQGVCDCISDAAECVVADDVSSDDYAELFSYLCGEISCAGITGNGTSGEYGAYSFCSSKDQLNFLLNYYYQQQDKDSSACDFSGSASVQDSPKTTGSCSAVLEEAGSAGTGSVTASVSGSLTGAVEAGVTTGSSGSAGSGSSSSSSSSGKSAAAHVAASNNMQVAGLIIAGLAAVFAVAF